MGALSKTNTVLLLLIICVNLYVVITPLLPAVTYNLPASGERRRELTQKVSDPPVTATSAPLPNEVIVPSMLLDQPILDGTDTYAVLNKGILRWPGSSTPDKGGNTVLLGHRFSYSTPKGVLYHLDKVQVGDDIGIVWDKRHYRYKVSEVKVVKPTETSVLDNTTTPRLTLFTCTPLYWPKDRLVVIAEEITP